MNIALSGIKNGCLLTLRYFGIFRYPMTWQEIHRFNSARATEQDIRTALDDLIREAEIYQAGIYFMAENRPEWVKERLEGNEKALQLLQSADKYAGMISSFPFVRGVAISGSLSKFCVTRNPDIDYFIITATDRLWISRSLLHLFKKLTFLTGHQHYFCMNYFIDASSLKITHPNLYTSIETVTLLPVINQAIFNRFMDENDWIEEYLPNHTRMLNQDYLLKERKHPVKIMLEWFMDRMAPARLNRSLMKLTDMKWRRKWRKKGYPSSEYDKAFMTSLHISKNHPVDYEKKVLSTLSQYKFQIQENR